MVTDDAVGFMADLDERFRNATGLFDRRYYSMFYSRLQPARIMVIGIKPGGRTDGSHQLASQGFYEDWSHEYVDQDYRIAAVMRPALMKALGASSADDLRGVPKTNTFFQRAVGTDDFSAADLTRNVQQCAPYLTEMLAFVRPDAIVLEGSGARDNFVRHQCTNVEIEEGSEIYGLRRGASNRFFRKELAFIRPIGKVVTLLTLGHPSQFGHLPTWPKAVEAMRINLGADFLPTWGGEPERKPEALHRLEIATIPDSSREGVVSSRQAPAKTTQKLSAAIKPPETFRYSPIHDFWQELNRIGSSSPEELHVHLNSIGWRRPSRKPLTTAIVRTDLVSMVKHGFASRT